jgi:SAM-dependent methyltransferase
VKPDGGAEFDQVFQLPILDQGSLVYIPNDTMPDITEGGRNAALWFYTGLESGSKEAAEKAREAFHALVPKEKFGDEYTAFEWLCEYLLASPNQQQDMLRDPLINSYFRQLSANEYEVLKHYLWSRYKFTRKDDGSVELEKDPREEIGDAEKTGSDSALKGETQLKITSALRVAFLNKDVTSPTEKPKYSLDEMVFWRDFILFNNPRRESWEQTSRIVDLLKLQPGQVVADIGAGPGYYSFKFSQLVGPGGQVYAVDTNKRHLDYVDRLGNDTGTKSIRTVLSELDNAKLPENSIDVGFLCSLYGVVYATSMEHVKDDFVASIRSALKPNGRLVIVDNSIVKPPLLPYHGPHIDPRLVIAQLSYYGFRLVEQVQVIPQRYVLIFEQTPVGD